MSDYYFYKQEEKVKSTRKPTNFLSESEDSNTHPQLRNAQRFFQPQTKDYIRTNQATTTIDLICFCCIYMSYIKYVPEPIPIPEAIRQIDKKIQAYRRVMELSKKQKEFQEQQRIIEESSVSKHFVDFFTNPNIQLQYQSDDDKEEKQISVQKCCDEIQTNQSPQIKKQPRQQYYSESVKNRDRIYDNMIERYFAKRQNPAMFAKLKKKPPALNITSKNKIQSGNGRMDIEEHKLRVYNRENVPTMPELIIPTFMIKKDSISKNILAYLKDYSPIYRQQNNNDYPRCVQNILEDQEDVIRNDKK
ncbi:unnamed protein product (macronuclear) [Paramecium tetraurelia]|uniref:Uncharacterized protein n=1 Tax=Paramecium tetraurelia TaxID=5888 RepID=A0CXD4_PARTE|nr:uncharacterized protein GSPATT00011083001 [Paramecium tetraurelia]CAK75451.1 unnamed protein product [Paramecium tetraurelia]|eukprot:XP_001442848.1 hypothetical protein (macronuclear) [Paramecium tetraurelia strain d4-2]